MLRFHYKKVTILLQFALPAHKTLIEISWAWNRLKGLSLMSFIIMFQLKESFKQITAPNPALDNTPQ